MSNPGVYKQCTKCNAHGYVWFDLSESKCEDCNGTGLTSSVTGEPPKSYKSYYDMFDELRK